MSFEYQFRRLDDTLLGKLIPLYKAAFDLELTRTQIFNKFNTSDYAHRKYIAYIALDTEGNAIAQYAIFPALLTYQGKEILAGQVGDLMTHPDHQRKGLFVKLATLTHDLAKQEGMKLIYTFPFGQNSSYQGFEKHLGFTSQKMNSYIIRVDTLPLCRFAHKTSVTLGIYNVYLKNILGNFYPQKSEFASKCAAKENAIVKNSAFFTYKMAYTSGRVFALNNAAVYQKLTKFGSVSVGDFEHYNKMGDTILQLKSYCFWAGIRSIRIEVVGENEMNTFLKANYSFENEYYASVLKLDDTIDTSNLNFVFGDFDNF